MHKTNGFLILLALVAVILLGFIAGKVAEPPQAAPTYTPWPTYTPRPTYTPYPTVTPILLPTSSFVVTDLERDIMQNYPHVDGSTSTKPLQDTIICALYNLYCPWQRDPISLENTIRFFSWSGDYRELSFPPTGLLPPVAHTGTHDAYVNLINGNADFILVARLPSADEQNEAETNGVVLDARPVALDAFVMLAHADNPVDTISPDQIRGIYSGRITNWSQIGGLNHPINAYQREENSGSQELLKSLVMGDKSVIDMPDMVVHSMMGPFNALEGVPSENVPGDPNGIAYSVYYYTWFIMPPLQDVKTLAVNGIRPTSQTIANRTYPLVAEVYVVIRAGEPQDATSVLLRDWILSSIGQLYVRLSGYVPIHYP